MVSRILLRIEFLVFCLFITTLFSASDQIIVNLTDEVRLFTRKVEFDYFDWTIKAIKEKLDQATINSPYTFKTIDRHKIVLDYINLIGEISNNEQSLNRIYIDPAENDPVRKSKEIRIKIDQLNSFYTVLSPLSEAILEEQISEVIRTNGLSFARQPVPPVLFHITPLPYNIVISPRTRIQQDASISLIPSLDVESQVELEKEIDSALDVSSLVVPVGGIGSYPTMVERSTSLEWLSNTIAHEWIHNWLGLRPLGMRYGENNDIRTMNETTASIAGDEIGKLLIQRFYPELITETNNSKIGWDLEKYNPRLSEKTSQFDFRAEMHQTRVEVDELLAAGKVTEAEDYMEKRRQVFWDNGYLIRKLNQAYFAFYGAYAEIPGGAAGEDPVGPAVRKLREQSNSLHDFLEKISRMTSFNELKASIEP